MSQCWAEAFKEFVCNSPSFSSPLVLAVAATSTTMLYTVQSQNARIFFIRDIELST